MSLPSRHIIAEHSKSMFHSKIFPKCIIFLKFLSQALRQLRTSEFKPYVIFVKPAIQEKRKTPPMSPTSEDTAAPLVRVRLILSFLKACYSYIRVLYRPPFAQTFSFCLLARLRWTSDRKAQGGAARSTSQFRHRWLCLGSSPALHSLI